MAEWAVEYVQNEWAVIPLYGIVDGSCTCQRGASCQSAGKHPKWPEWQNRPLTDQGDAAVWFTDNPDDNIGIVCGASGLVVVDFDSEEGEEHAKRWSLPLTLVAHTRRGRHLYFTAPDGLAMNSVKFSGLDVKAGNGFVVAPPSKRIDGHEYTWRYWDTCMMSEAPQMLLDDAAEASAGKRSAVRESARSGEPIPSGTRDDTLMSIAGYMRRGGLLENEIRAALLEVNKRCQPPLEQMDVERIAASAARYERGDFATRKHDVAGDWSRA